MVIPRSRLMSMCCWMRSNFHNWIDYYSVTFLYELLEWDSAFSDFWGQKIQGQNLGI